MYFRNYGLAKTWLNKCLKSLVSDYPSTGNMVKRPKCCFSHNDSIFTIFIDHCQSNLVGKSLS